MNPKPGDRGTTDTGLPAIWQGNDWRVLGALPATSASLAGVPRAAALLDQWAIPPIPESDWGRASLEEITDLFTLDQDGRGSCACEAVASSAFSCLYQQLGQLVLFNPWVLYALVTTADRGSIATENVQVAHDVGLCPMSKWDRSQHGWPSLPPDYKTLCAPYAVGEWFVAETLPELVTCLELKIPGCVGVTWSGGGGHEIQAVRWDKARNGLVTKNSWGAGYGGTWTKPTYDLLSRRQVESGLQTFGGAVFIRSVKLST